MHRRKELLVGWVVLAMVDVLYVYLIFFRTWSSDESGLAKLLQAAFYGFLLGIVNLLWINETIKKPKE